MHEESPELKELTKQTLLMAEKEAEKGASGGCFLGLLIGCGLFIWWPSTVTAALLFVLPVGLAITLYRHTKNRFTKRLS